MALVVSKDSWDKEHGQADWYFIVESIGDRRCGEATRVCILSKNAAKSEAEQAHIIYLAKLSLGTDGLPGIEALKEPERLADAAMLEEQAEAIAGRYLDEQADGTFNLVSQVMEAQARLVSGIEADCKAVEASVYSVAQEHVLEWDENDIAIES